MLEHVVYIKQWFSNYVLMSPSKAGGQGAKEAIEVLKQSSAAGVLGSLI